MNISKKDLVEQAKRLNISSVGTKKELLERIAAATEGQDTFDAPIVEKIERQDGSIEQRITHPAEVREAIPANIAEDLATRKALKSTVKFIGRWYTLRKDKNITAPRDVIDSLESLKLVGKK